MLPCCHSTGATESQPGRKRTDAGGCLRFLRWFIRSASLVLLTILSATAASRMAMMMMIDNFILILLSLVKSSDSMRIMAWVLRSRVLTCSGELRPWTWNVRIDALGWNVLIVERQVFVVSARRLCNNRACEPCRSSFIISFSAVSSWPLDQKVRQHAHAYSMMSAIFYPIRAALALPKLQPKASDQTRLPMSTQLVPALRLRQ